MNYRPLTEEELATLMNYRNHNGRTWKHRLLEEWMSASLEGQDQLLHNLRNSHGPTWLATVHLPKGTR